MSLKDTPIIESDIWKPTHYGRDLIREIRRQRRELLRKSKEPKVLYMGTNEYAEFRRNLKADDPFFMHQVFGGPVMQSFEGMEVIERLKPGIHVCEAAP